MILALFILGIFFKKVKQTIEHLNNRTIECGIAILISPFAILWFVVLLFFFLYGFFTITMFTTGFSPSTNTTLTLKST